MLETQLRDARRASEEANKIVQEGGILGSDWYWTNAQKEHVEKAIKARDEADKKIDEIMLKLIDLRQDASADETKAVYDAKEADLMNKKKTADYAVIDRQIKTNSLTARGGFAGGAAVTDEVSFRQGVKDKISTIATAISTIMKDTDTLAKKGDEKL